MDMSQLDQVNNAKSTIVFLEIIVVDHYLKLYKVLSQTTCLQFVTLGNFANCKVVVRKYVSKFYKFFIAHNYFLLSFCLKILQIVVPEKSLQITKIVFPETLFANYTNSCYG